MALDQRRVANQLFRALFDLEVAQVQSCAVLQNQPDVIRSHTLFRLRRDGK
jgi:hypothetical protein